MTASIHPVHTMASSADRTLEDRIALTDLVSRLGAALDEHRFDALRELFVEDATATTPGGVAEGRDAVIAQATRNHVGFSRLHHVMTNVLVEFDDIEQAGSSTARTARVRANLTARFAHDDGVPVLTLGAVYRLGVRHAVDGWRICELRVTPVWREAAA